MWAIGRQRPSSTAYVISSIGSGIIIASANGLRRPRALVVDAAPVRTAAFLRCPIHAGAHNIRGAPQVMAAIRVVAEVAGAEVRVAARKRKKRSVLG